MKTTIGFIGCGNLTRALLKGLVNHSYDMSSIRVYDLDKERSLQYQKQFNVINDSSLTHLVQSSSHIVLSVKPQQYHDVIQEIKKDIKEQTIISPAAGLDIDFIADLFGKSTKIIRIMPNTPSSVNAGITGAAYNNQVTPKELQQFETIFNHFGIISYIKETEFDRFTAIFGSGPAFVYLFLDALSTFASLQLENQKDQAMLISQLVEGTAKLAATSLDSFKVLREQVTSKGGVTIAGVNHIMSSDFSRILSGALTKTVQRSEELSKEIKSK